MGEVISYSGERFFIDALAEHILQDVGADDPLALAKMRVLLPHRRGGRALKEALLRQSPQESVILPGIYTLGDIRLEEWLPPDHPALFDMPPTISARKRLSWVCEFLLHETEVQAMLPERLGMVSALRYAESFLGLRDDCLHAGISHHTLAGVVPDDYAEHWANALAAFEHVMGRLDDWLREQGLIETASAQRRAAQLLATHWTETMPETPVWAAGSTGSMPATATLIGGICALPHGKIIIPGLDWHMPDAEWQVLDTGHPQYALKQLLASLNVERREVRCIHIGESARDEALSLAMVPQEGVERLATAEITPHALDGVDLIESSDDIAEAEITALHIRDAIEQGMHDILVISDDVAYGEHISALLEAYGIPVSNSAGVAIQQEPAYRLLMLSAQLLAAPYESATLLAFLRHPDVGRQGREAIDAMADALDGDMLRGFHGFSHLADVLQAYRQCDASGEASAILAPLAETSSELEAAPLELSPQRLISAHLTMLRQVATIDEGVPSLLVETLEGFAESLSPATSLRKRDYTELLRQLFAGIRVGKPALQNAPVKILGGLEARLQRADLLIVPQLNEGRWPKRISPEPWLNLAMRRQLGLDFAERRIGLAAHDLQLMLKAPRIILSRARKEANAPTRSSRYMERLRLVQQIAQASQHEQPRADMVSLLTKWRHAWQQRWMGGQEPLAIEQPAPSPPVALRMDKLSATGCETLMDNPFAYYVKNICHLRERDPLDGVYDHKEFGITLHHALEQAAQHYRRGDLSDYKAALQHRIGEELAAHVPAAQRAFHQQRLQRILAQLIAEEDTRNGQIDRLEAEAWLRLPLNSGEYRGEKDNTPLILEAKLDRVERWQDGTVRIVDYKTGEAPKASDVQSGRRCQLLVAGVILRGQDRTTEERIAGLEYWRLSGKAGDTMVAPVYSPEIWQELDWQEVERELTRLACYYARDPDARFVWNPEAKTERYPAAAHIARLGEW